MHLKKMTWTFTNGENLILQESAFPLFYSAFEKMKSEDVATSLSRMMNRVQTENPLSEDFLSFINSTDSDLQAEDFASLCFEFMIDRKGIACWYWIVRFFDDCYLFCYAEHEQAFLRYETRFAQTILDAVLCFEELPVHHWKARDALHTAFFGEGYGR